MKTTFRCASSLNNSFLGVIYCVLVATALSTFSTTNVSAIPLSVRDNPEELAKIRNRNLEAADFVGSNSDEIGTMQSQPATRFSLDSVATFVFGSNLGSDCWGWQQPGGDLYAIMGIDEGIVFVNVTTQTVSDTIPHVGDPCLWQDMATVGNYCYSVSECGNGLMIMDMSFLPDSVHFVGSVPTNNSGAMSSHNLCIDSLTDHIYLEGNSGANRNIFIHDISNRENPVYVAGFDNAGTSIHDMYVYNDLAYIAEGSSHTYSIWDMTSKTSPSLLARWFIFGAGYAHNIWPTEDGKHVVTTEETNGHTVKFWNIEDLEDIKLVGEFLGSSELPHNAHVRGDFVYLSHYESGVYMIDISRPNCPEEVAQFDTWPSSNNGNFNGCWGAFPFTNDDSLVFAANGNGRLFILKINEDPSVVSPDSDGDGVRDFCDNCLDTPNPDQLDVDEDGVGDICDQCPNSAGNDTDNDDVCDDIDNCVFTANIDQLDSDGDGIGDVCDACPNDADNDIDGDGFCADVDNCPSLSNTFQNDSDFDGIGDACDVCPNDKFDDIDGDGFCADVDNCDDISNTGQGDADGDGVGDACDVCAGEDDNIDTDNDGVPDACDECPLEVNPCTCCDVAGDGNSDGAFNIADVTFGIARIFAGGAAPDCQDEADSDGDNSFNIADVTYCIARIFGGGPAPVCGTTGT